jgi:hypothetical protein
MATLATLIEVGHATLRKNTTVSSDQSLIEIKRMMEPYGASVFHPGYDGVNGQRVELIEFKMSLSSPSISCRQ